MAKRLKSGFKKYLLKKDLVVGSEMKKLKAGIDSIELNEHGRKYYESKKII